MIENLIGKRYAEALSDSIADDSRLSGVLENLRALVKAFSDETDLGRFFAHPSISKESKGHLVHEMAARISADECVERLLQLLVQRNKILHLPIICDYFERVVDERLNQVRALVCSASDLSFDNKKRLSEELSRIIGKTVLIETRVDESLIGGVILQVGDLVADATLKNRLALLKRKIETEEGV